MNESKLRGGVGHGASIPRIRIRQNIFQAQLPNLIKAINRLADAIEKQNELKEEEKKNDQSEN